MNGPTRKKMYDLLSKQDGETCAFCGRLPEEIQLIVDHKDNNNGNNNLSNLQLLCRRCNYIKNPRRPVDLSESEDEEETELQKSRRLRPLVRQFVLHEINERGEVPEKELQDGGAEEFSCAQETIKRIISAMCSFRGPLERILRVKTIMIRYKPELPDI